MSQLSAIPSTLEEMKELPESSLTNAEDTALLTIAAFARYKENPEEALRMIDFLKGPAEVSAYEKQFIKDRFATQDFIPMSYFKGSSPENGYTPSAPYEITIIDNPHGKDQLSEGYLTLYLKSSGADSPRMLKFRNKPSTGQWFLHEQFVLVSIKEPVSSDWA